MALVTFKGGILIPHRPPQRASAYSYGSMALTNQNFKAAGILQIPRTGTITKVGWRTGTVTSGTTVDVRLETLDATTGNPTGTLIGANTNGLQIVNGGESDTWFTTTLTTGAVVTRGEFIAVVIANENNTNAGNINVSNLGVPGNVTIPHSRVFSAVTGAWSAIQSNPVMALEYSDGSYPIIRSVFPFASLPAVSIDVDSSPDEVGLAFTLNYNVECTGFWSTFSNNQDCIMRLYDHGGNTVIASKTMQQNTTGEASVGNYHQRLWEDSTFTLFRDRLYRLAIAPQEAAPDLDGIAGVVASAALMGALEGGANLYWTERTNGGVWSDNTLKRPIMGIIASQVDAAGT